MQIDEFEKGISYGKICDRIKQIVREVSQTNDIEQTLNMYRAEELSMIVKLKDLQRGFPEKQRAINLSLRELFYLQFPTYCWNYLKSSLRNN